MVYDDDKYAPKTAEEYERQAAARVVMTGAEAKDILKAHGVKGRSKLKAEEAIEIAKCEFPSDVKPLLAGKTMRFRWPVAHGLRVSYAELAEIEKAAGVEPVDNGSARGGYANAEDVGKVYATAKSVMAKQKAVEIRMVYTTREERIAADAVLDAIRERYRVEGLDTWKGETMTYLNATVFVPLN